MNAAVQTVERAEPVAGEVQQMPKPMEAITQGLEKMEDALRTALPAHLPVERFTRVCLTAIQMSPYLLRADRKSLFLACMKCAQDGLLPDGRDAALVPFRDNKRSKEEGHPVWSVQYMPMVAGILKKVRNSGELKTISAQVVYENDKFFYRLGDDEKIEHEPRLDGERGKARLVYAVAHTKDGGVYREVMTVADVNKVRNVSKAKDDGPWVTWWEEMARKTAIRRLSKRLPMSGDLDDVVRADDDLYDFEGARQAGERALPRPDAVKGALDIFAGNGQGIDAGRSDDEGEDAGAETTEQTPQTATTSQDATRAPAQGDAATAADTARQVRAVAGRPPAPTSPVPVGTSSMDGT